MRAKFVKAAVEEHCKSTRYHDAKEAEAYYAKHNTTIEKFQKFLRTISGQQIPDIWSANHKLKTLFYRRFVIQQVQFVLSNGITFSKEDTAKKLGPRFCSMVKKLATRAMNSGVGFGFWNLDHLEVFSLVDTSTMPGFVPLYDEKSGRLCAGIRFWSAPSDSAMNYTLYEADGYTEYAEDKNDKLKVKAPKAGYIRHVSSSKAAGVEGVSEENYKVLPIIPLYANDLLEPELNGIREDIDCYDLIKSGLANNIDDASELYWIVKNAGGMDDPDLAQFLERMRTVHAAALDAEDGVDAEAHTLNIPTEARERLLDRIERDLYKDFQVVNTAELSAAQKTATEIRSAYQPMVDKCSFFRDYISDFIAELFDLIGIEDEPTYRFNQITNQLEETQMIMTASAVLGEELTLRKLPFLTPKEKEDRLNEMTAEEIGRFRGQSDDEPQE